MNLKNRIINYFVTKPDQNGVPLVFQCPVTIPAKEGEELLRRQLKNKGRIMPQGSIMHVCYDLDSEYIYVINANIFSGQEKALMLKAAEVRISKDFGALRNIPPIEGSPFSSLRVRSVSSFGFVEKSIKEHFNDSKFTNLPVLEVNLARMPYTTKKLPAIFANVNFTGGYVSPQQAPYIDFIDELDNDGKKRKEPLFLLRQKTPFILLNISPQVEITAADKERTVIFGYRDYVFEQSSGKGEDEKSKTVQNAAGFADLYAAKRFLYYGYPFEEVCYVLLETAKDFGQLYGGIQRLMRAANELADDGYPNPARIPYYMTFKIDKNKFPLKLSSLSSDGVTFDPARQPPYFMVIEYDPQTEFILIETPAFINPDLCMRLLGAKNRPLITRYNHAIKKVDVKSTQGVFKEYEKEKNQLDKITALSLHDLKNIHEKPEDAPSRIEFRTDERARGVSMSNNQICNLRKISDFYYACDHIKKVCKKRGVPFMDLEVVIGPLERVFGRGVKGGFMDKDSFVKSKMKIPHELEKGLFVTPPLIAIDSVDMQGYDQQTSTLIHEYCHNLFSITNPEWQHVYNTPAAKEKRKKDENWYWYTYLTDPDERQAHTEQIKHELRAGMSPDEIIRDKVGGQITTKNYPIALKFKELVDECIEQLDREETANEKPDGNVERPRGSNQGNT